MPAHTIPHPARRLMFVALALVGWGVSSCGQGDGVLDTLPPIRSTTTTSSTTTTAAPSEPRYYVIQRGETLSIIAERFGVTVAAIVDLNEITNPDRIEAGVTIEIPNKANVP
jgi:LysM repeat protein